MPERLWTVGLPTCTATVSRPCRWMIGGSRRDLGERLPGGRAQLAVAADQRPVQAVGVVVQVPSAVPWGR